MGPTAHYRVSTSCNLSQNLKSLSSTKGIPRAEINKLYINQRDKLRSIHQLTNKSVLNFLKQNNMEENFPGIQFTAPLRRARSAAPSIRESVGISLPRTTSSHNFSTRPETAAPIEAISQEPDRDPLHDLLEMSDSPISQPPTQYRTPVVASELRESIHDLAR